MHVFLLLLCVLAWGGWLQNRGTTQDSGAGIHSGRHHMSGALRPDLLPPCDTQTDRQSGTGTLRAPLLYPITVYF